MLFQATTSWTSEDPLSSVFNPCFSLHGSYSKLFNTEEKLLSAQGLKQIRIDVIYWFNYWYVIKQQSVSYAHSHRVCDKTVKSQQEDNSQNVFKSCGSLSASFHD